MVFIALRWFNYISDQFLLHLRAFPSIILADLLRNKCLLVIDAFPSTLFVSVFQGSLLVIALFRIVSGSGRLVFSVTYAAIIFGRHVGASQRCNNLASPYKSFIKLD